MKITTLLLLLTLPAVAQKIEKIQPFSYNELKKINGLTRPLLTNMSLNADNGNLKVYAFHGIRANVKEKVEAKTKAGKILGGLSSFSGSDYVTIIPYVTTLTFDNGLKQVEKVNGYVSPIPLETGKKYEVDEPPFISGIDYPQIKDIPVDYKGFLEQNSDFEKSLPTYSYTSLFGKGDGLLGNKNPRLNAAKNIGKFELKNGYPIRRNEESNLQKEKWEANFKGFFAFNNSNFLSKMPNGTYIQLVTQEDKDDNYAAYRNFCFINFDSEGNFLSKEIFKPEFIKSMISMMNVFDEKGEHKGVVYIFGNAQTMGAKKQKDPVENKYQAFYFGKDGKLKYKSEFTNGDNPEKDWYVNPMFIVEKADKLNILNTTYTSFTKSNIENLVIDAKGKVSATKIDPVKYTASSGTPGFSLYVTNPIFSEGKFYDYSLLTENKEVAQKDGTKITVKYYTGLILNEIDTDFNVTYRNLIVKQKASKTPIEVFPIERNGKKYLIVNHESGNSIISLDAKKEILNVVPKEGFAPITESLSKNFIYDEKNGVIYFVYENDKIGEGQIIKVSF